jgi:hypothetical protein
VRQDKLECLPLPSLIMPNLTFKSKHKGGALNNRLAEKKLVSGPYCKCDMTLIYDHIDSGLYYKLVLHN